MRLWCHISAVLTGVFLLLSCGRQQSPAPPPIEAEWPCFNGCRIIQQGGKFGLVTDDGKEILPSMYERIEFLAEEVALLSLQGEYSLADRSGRVWARSHEEDSLRKAWPALLEKTLDEDRRSWEEVVHSYEQLCRSCKARRGQRLSRREFASLKALQDSVMHCLQQASGVPTASQRARLDALSAQYRRAF